MSLTEIAACQAPESESSSCPQSLICVSKRDRSRWRAIGLAAFCFFLAGHVRSEEAAGKGNTRETLIRISTDKEGGSTRLFVENVQSADVTVTFEMDLVNLDSSVTFPYTTTLAPKSKVQLFTLSPHDKSRGWSWTYTYYSTFGSTSAEHDDTCIYTLPYSPGKAFRVSQGFNGEYSHFGADQYAVDWRMPLGTRVHAARSGVVVGVKNDSNIGGGDSKYDWDANYILIKHADGTLGQYVHLQKGGAVVKVGQHVEAGDFIGLSGNTGHSTGPHLHFSVFKAKDGKHRVTLPIRYRTSDNLGAYLEEGHSYKAANSAMLAEAAREKNTPLANISQSSAGSLSKISEPASAHENAGVGY